MAYSSSLELLLADPALLPDPEWVLDTLETYPTFVLPAALLLARNPGDIDEEMRQRLKVQVLMNCPDRAALADLVDIAGEDWANLYPADKTSDERTTEQTIDDFLNTYGRLSAKEEAIIEQQIFHPVAPYDLEKIEAEAARESIQAPEQEPEVESVPESPRQPEKPRKETVHDGANNRPLMESLAKIYIKRGRYARAYEIISTLSLNNPEKSVYFADQLRFLRKLMINQGEKPGI